MGWFANSVTWFRLGDAYRAHAYAGDTGGSFSRTIGTILAERLLDMGLVLLLLALATFFLALNDVGISWVFLGLAAIMAVGLAGIILMMSVFRSRLAGGSGPPERGPPAVPPGDRGKLPKASPGYAAGGTGLDGRGRRLFLVVEALGFPLGLPLVIFVTLASAMLTLVPITPGGLGAVEWGVTGLLLLSPVVESETAAFSIVALDRSISWLSVIVVGAAFFLGREVIRRRRRLPSPAGEAVHGKG